MAQYSTLPIYKATYDFLIRIMHAVSHFPREYKYTIGQKIQNEAMDLIILIYKINSSSNKVPLLKEMQERIQLVYLLLRIAHDMKMLSTEKFAGIVEMVDGVATQTKGWLRSNEKVREPADVTA